MFYRKTVIVISLKNNYDFVVILNESGSKVLIASPCGRDSKITPAPNKQQPITANVAAIPKTTFLVLFFMFIY